jgi:hypothetical protein
MATMRGVLLGESYGFTKMARVRVPVPHVSNTANSAYGVNDGGSDSANRSDGVVEPLEREDTRSAVVMGATTCLVSAFTNISTPVRPDAKSKSRSMSVNPRSRPLGLWDSWDKTTPSFRLRLPSWLLALQPQMGPLPDHSISTLLTWFLSITQLVNFFALPFSR